MIYGIFFFRKKLMNCLRQRPDLPLCFPFVDEVIKDRFNVIRDYILVRSCCLLVNHIHCNQSNLSTLLCIVHSAAPRHLVGPLLTTLGVKPDSNVGNKMSNHLEVILWALENNLSVTGISYFTFY